MSDSAKFVAVAPCDPGAAVKARVRLLNVFQQALRLLASTGQDAAVYVWDAATAAQVAALRGASLPMWSMAWSPDGSRLAAGNGRYEGSSISSTVFMLAMPEP